MKKTSKTITQEIVAVDLFCGAGGLTRGLADAGVHVRMGIDLDPACKYAYEANNHGAKFLMKSVKEVTERDLSQALSGGITLLAGCAPCQTFSKYNQKAKNTDERWWLLAEFGRLVKELHPDLVTMENVKELKDKDVFSQFVEGLKAENYHVSIQVVDCSEYGIPQQRHRLVLLASRFGKVSLIPSSRYKRKTAREAIGNLPELTAGSVDSKDTLHRCARLSPLNMKRIRASNPGGSWRDWPEELIAECHKRSSGKTYGGVYGRMTWDDPAPTMTTQFYGFGNGRFGHPEQDRGLSLREGALIQTFPRDYKFIDPSMPFSISTVGRLIGNAVPVKLGEVIGKSLVLHVQGLKNKLGKHK